MFDVLVVAPSARAGHTIYRTSESWPQDTPPMVQVKTDALPRVCRFRSAVTLGMA